MTDIPTPPPERAPMPDLDKDLCSDTAPLRQAVGESGTIKPRRIQRSRAKGWRMPEGAVYVGRGSIWGNPFVVGQPSGIFDGKDGRPLGFRDEVEILIPIVDLDTSLRLYRDLVQGFVAPEMYPFGRQWSRDMHKKCGGHPAEIARAFLRGKVLACWCPLSVPCHADVLLELANG